MTHTPGPWRITTNITPGRFVTDTKIRDKHDSVIAVLHVDIKENARLISAAPDLLEALELVYANAGESAEWIREKIMPAITKARG